MIPDAMAPGAGGSKQPIDLPLIEEVLGPLVGVGGDRFRSTLNIPNDIAAEERAEKGRERLKAARDDPLAISGLGLLLIASGASHQPERRKAPRKVGKRKRRTKAKSLPPSNVVALPRRFRK